MTDTSSFEASNVAIAAATQRDSSTPNWQLNPGCRPRPRPVAFILQTTALAMQFSNNLLYSLKAHVLPNQNRWMTQLEEKFPVPLAIRSSSRVDLTRPKGGDRCDGGPCRQLPTDPQKRMGWLTPSTFLPSLFLVTFCPRLLLSPKARGMMMMRSIFSVVIACSLPSFQPRSCLPSQHNTSQRVSRVGEMRAGVGGINLIYAP